MTTVRSDWTISEVAELFALPLMELVRTASAVHSEFHDPDVVHVNQLLSVKTGACPEDCGYCSQSAVSTADIETYRLMPREDLVAAAKGAVDRGARRYCMVTSGRGPSDRDVEHFCEATREIKSR